MPTAQPVHVPGPRAPMAKGGALELRAHLAPLLPELKSRALHLTRNPSWAEDLVQDTIERALRFQEQYQPGSNLRAWMHAILFSVFVTRCRRLRREKVALSALALDPCAWTTPDEPFAAAPLSPPLARALARLPEGFRDAVELVDLMDLSYKDAALHLGVPLGTVMSRLHRGRRMLQEALGTAERRAAPPAAKTSRTSNAKGLAKAA